MSLSLAQDLYMDRLQKGSLFEVQELSDFLRIEKEIEIKPEVQAELKNWIYSLENLQALQEFIQDQSINEILIHDEEMIQLERLGKLENVTLEKPKVLFNTLYDVLALKEHQHWNYQNPFKSFKVRLLEHDFRATLVHESLSPYLKPKLFLRRLKGHTLELKDFNLDANTEAFLSSLIREKQNVLFCGATGSGKTSLLSSLLKQVPMSEHVVVLEDTHELGLERKNFTYLLGQEIQNKTLKDYCKYAMRIRPDRMVIGELRGEETVPFLLSMNNGHKGLMSTIHAHSASEAPMRLAMLFSLYAENVNMNLELILRLVCSNVDYVVHLEDKQVREVVRLLGSEGATPYFEKIF